MIRKPQINAGWRRATLAAVPLVLAVACSTHKPGQPAAAPASPPATASTAPTQLQQPSPRRSPSWTYSGLPTAAPTLSPTATYSPTAVAISPGPQAFATFDWLHPTPLTIGGWTLRSCPDQTRGACVDHAGTLAGTVTVDVVSLSSRPDLREIYSQDGPKAALRAAAERYLDQQQAAHTRRCSSGYRFTRTAPSVFTVRGTYVLSYGYVGRTQDGHTDMALRYAGIRDDRLAVISASARAAGSCDPPSTATFDSNTVTAFLPLLDSTVRAVRFP